MSLKSPDRTFARCSRVAVVLPIIALCAPVAAQESAGMTSADLIAALKEGGHVVFIRHGSTEADYADQIDADMGDCSTQRTLSEAGWREAKEIGAAFARLEIQLGQVVSSEYCRASQTAELAFGNYEKTADLNFEPAEGIPTHRSRRCATMWRRIWVVFPDEGNTILVGHDDPFEAATGIYPEPMGVVFVIRPGEDGGFKVLGSIAPGDWSGIGG